MPQNIPNKFVIDLTPQKAVGVGIPFSGGGDAVFNSNYTTKDQIKSNLINFLLTNDGERVFQPNYGGNVSSYLFEQITPSSIDFLKKRIEDDIKTYFPLVEIKDFEIIDDSNYNTIQVIISYNIVNFGIEDQINLNFQK